MVGAWCEPAVDAARVVRVSHGVPPMCMAVVVTSLNSEK
jgi:hypothetical protein